MINMSKGSGLGAPLLRIQKSTIMIKILFPHDANLRQPYMNTFPVVRLNPEEDTMGELMPRDYYNPVPIKRDTRKRLARIEQEAMVRQAALEAAAEDTAYQMEAREQLAAGQALLRVKGTYDLGGERREPAAGADPSQLRGDGGDHGEPGDLQLRDRRAMSQKTQPKFFEYSCTSL